MDGGTDEDIVPKEVVGGTVHTVLQVRVGRTVWC